MLITIKHIRILLALVLLASPLAHTNANEQFVKEIEETRAIYLKAVNDNNKRNLRKAIRHINKLSQKYPKHPLVMVYLGCSLAQRGRDIGERPLNRMRETEEGLRHIDRGLRLLRRNKLHFLESAEAQLLAAYTFIHLPDTVFHRLKEGSHLVKQLLANPRFEEMPIGMQAGIYFAASIVADKHNDKEKLKHYLKLTLDTDPQGENAQKAKAKLAELGEPS